MTSRATPPTVRLEVSASIPRSALYEMPCNRGAMVNFPCNGCQRDRTPEGDCDVDDAHCMAPAPARMPVYQGLRGRAGPLAACDGYESDPHAQQAGQVAGRLKGHAHPLSISADQRSVEPVWRHSDRYATSANL